MAIDSKTKKFPKKEIWISVTEAADLGGINSKTIRRALKENETLVYKIVKDRYKIELESLINFMNLNTKLSNKFRFLGLGQYVEKWRESKNGKIELKKTK